MWTAIRGAASRATVEPVYLAVSVHFILNNVIAQELFIQKTCRVNWGFNESLCQDLQQHETEQVQVQKDVSRFQVIIRTVGILPALLVTLLSGPWSDAHGRKPVILVVLTGFVLESVVLLANAVWFHELRAEFMLVELIGKFFGHWPCFQMIVFAYLSDVTGEKSRTRQMAVMGGMFHVGCMAGLMVGLLSKRLGFVFVFAVSLLMALFSMFYTIFVLKESKKVISGDASNDSTKLWKKLIRMFNLKKIKENVQVLTVKRDGKKRRLLVIVVLCFGLECGINVADTDFIYLYLRRKLDFTLMDFVVFRNVTRILSMLTLFVIVPLISTRCRDSRISLVDIATSIVQNILTAMATKTWMIYLATVIALLDSCTYAVITSMASKLVAPEETGRILCVTMVVGAIGRLIGSPLFGETYRLTLSFMPEVIFYIFAGLYAVFGMMVLYLDANWESLEGSKTKIKHQEKTEQEKMIC